MNTLGGYFSVPSNHESPSTCARLRPETLSPSTLVGLLQHGNVEYDVHGTAVPLAYLDLHSGHSVDIHPEVPQVGGDGKKTNEDLNLSGNMVKFHLLQLDLQLTSAVVNGRLGLDCVGIIYVHAPAGDDVVYLCPS